MNIRDLHRKAIDNVKEANVFLSNGDTVRYHEFILKAYEDEKSAAVFLKDMIDNEPTRSVLYRSAANLAYILGNYEEAYDLIIQALNGNPFDELKNELANLLTEVVNKKQSNNLDLATSLISNGYLYSLRDDSVPIKLEEKSGKYGGGFVISHLIEFLKNIQNSYTNYAEIQFNKTIKETDVKDYEYSRSKFLSGCNLIGVNLKFSSFGVDIVAEKSFMNPMEIPIKEFAEMKQNLFLNFKEEVLYPEYNDDVFQSEISTKYSSEERRKIFSPIVNSLTNSKSYNFCITDKTYFKKVKEFKPLDNKAKSVFKPDAEIVLDSPQTISLTKKIEQKIGSKSKLIVNEQLKNANFEITLSEITFDKKTIYFNQAHTINIVFDNNSFSISDDAFKIRASGNDYDKVLEVYYKCFVEMLSGLILIKEDLSDEDKNMLDFIENSTIRNW